MPGAEKKFLACIVVVGGELRCFMLQLIHCLVCSSHNYDICCVHLQFHMNVSSLHLTLVNYGSEVLIICPLPFEYAMYLTASRCVIS